MNMDVNKILGYVGLAIVISVVIYLALKVLGIVHTIGVEEILLGFAGGQALLDINLIRSVGGLKGEMGLIKKKLKV